MHVDRLLWLRCLPPYARTDDVGTVANTHTSAMQDVV